MEEVDKKIRDLQEHNREQDQRCEYRSEKYMHMENIVDKINNKINEQEKEIMKIRYMNIGIILNIAVTIGHIILYLVRK